MIKKYPKTKKAHNINIGQNIRLWRDVKGMKQEELAKLIGITAPALSQIENNKTEITITRIEDIAHVLDITLIQLLENPQQLISIYNSSTKVALKGSLHNTIDKEVLSKVVVLMENLQLLINPINDR